MILHFSPCRRDDRPAVERDGDALVIGGARFDFADLPDGGFLPAAAIASDWIAGDVERIDGVLHLHLALSHGQHAPRETRFPKPMAVTEDGPVSLPPYDTEGER